MDLFLGARLVPGKYGKLLGSHVLLNEGGRFKEVTSTVCPEMAGEFGNVSAAVAADFNKDGAMDLALAGEWMSVKILLNVNGKLQDQSEKWGLKNTGGWWNVLSVSDIDQDGDADLLAGNLGWNTKFKASVDKPFLLIWEILIKMEVGILIWDLTIKMEKFIRYGAGNAAVSRCHSLQRNIRIMSPLP
ncbi:MAG: VCBS repeat-containing protein [Saprospiraceae bacterium]|nr:VCBS repeat-containing protein [Candidatus Vicinibacter proximus]